MTSRRKWLVIGSACHPRSSYDSRASAGRALARPGPFPVQPPGDRHRGRAHRRPGSAGHQAASTRRARRRRSRASGCSRGCATAARAQLTLVACPAGFGKSTLLAAWREQEARAAGRVGHARRGRRRRRWCCGRTSIEALCRACPALAARRSSRPLAVDRAAARGRAAAARQRSSPSRATSRSCSTTSTGSRAPSARESVAWFVDHVPRDGPARARHAHRPGAAARHAARPRPAARAARRRAALHAAEADEFLNGRLGLGPRRPPTSSCSSPAPRAGRRASTSRRCRSPARRTSTRWSHAFDGTSAHVVDFLAERGARRLRRRSCRRSCCARRCSSGCARRCATRCSARDGSAAALDVARAHEPVPAPARRPPALVPLPPPVRPAPARRARAARARARRRAAPPRVRVAPRVGHDRRGDPPRRRRAARSPRPATLIAETLGPLRQRRAGPSSVLDWLARFPARVLDADPRLLLVQAWVSALRGREDEMRARGRRACASSAASTRARSPTASPRSSPASRCCARRSAGATCRRCSSTARARPSCEGPDSPWRPVVTWALGWAHYCAATSTTPSAGCARRARSRRRADQWIVGVGARSPTCR